MMNQLHHNCNMGLGVKHWICWKLGGHLTLEELEDEAKLLRRTIPELETVEYAIYLNPEHLKSIPDIEHGHILTFKSR